MIKKSVIIENYIKNKQDKQLYKSCFLLAFGRFFMYEELLKTDFMEVFDNLKDAKQIKSKVEYNNIVIPYSIENVTLNLIIELDRMVKYLNMYYNDILSSDIDDSVYPSQNLISSLIVTQYYDILGWLNILEDPDRNKNKYSKISDIAKFIITIAKRFDYYISNDLIQQIHKSL